MISVIVPVYNVEKYLHRCIESLLKQTYSNFELILIDDGSPDESGSICDNYAYKDKRIHVIHQKNGGLSAARNAGLDWVFTNSNSEYLCFIDSDDWVHEKYLEALLNAVLSNNAELAICDYIETTGDVPEIDESALKGCLVDIEEFYINKVVTATTAWGKIFKKNLFEGIRFPVGKLHEDEFVTYRVLFNSNKVAYIGQPLYYYYQNPNGIMLSKWNPRRMDTYEAFEEQAEYFKRFPKVHKAQGIRYLKSLNKTLNIVRAERNYPELERAIHKKLKRLLLRYRKEISWKTVPSIAEMEFPHFMKVYWVVLVQYNKILKVFGKK